MVVRTWFARVAAAHPELDPLLLHEVAFDALWARAQRTLGYVTLAAILDRVVADEVERYPFLVHLRVEYSGLLCDRLHEARASLLEAELVEALQSLLVSFLSVLGELTAEILTTALHGELDRIDIDQVARESLRERDEDAQASRAGDR